MRIPIIASATLRYPHSPSINHYLFFPLLNLPHAKTKTGCDLRRKLRHKSISLPRPMDATPRMDLPFTVLLPLFRSTANGKCSVTSRKRFTSSMLSNCTFFTVIVFFTSFLYLYYYFTMI